MKIARSPFHANISPQKGTDESLWHFIIRREGSTEIVVRRGASTKEDAWSAALFELARLHPAGKPVQREANH